jgi:hypothetical protein
MGSSYAPREKSHEAEYNINIPKTTNATTETSNGISKPRKNPVGL